MKILFVEIDTEQHWALASVGPACIAAYIRQFGHKADFLRIKPRETAQTYIGRISQKAPDVIGLSLTTHQWLRAREVARHIKAGLHLPVVAGGLHPTFAPESLLDADAFDGVCIGEGEEAACELLSQLEKGQRINTCRIANVWVKGQPRPCVRPPLRSLDRLPFMARDLLDEQHGVVHVTTQRGCPFACRYCAAPAFKTLYPEDGYLRRRSVENVVAELEQIKVDGPLNYVVFLDDTFTVNKDWVNAFCRIYGKRIGTGFSINARVESVDPDMLALLARAGCRHVIFGVESGSERVRRQVLNRNVSDDRIVNAFNWARAAGLMVTANYMFGLPTESRTEIEQTLSFNDLLSPDDFGYFVYQPFCGTPLFDECRDIGYLPENWLDIPVENNRSVLNLPNLTAEDIRFYYDQFSALREKIKCN